MAVILLKEGKMPKTHPVIWKCPKCKSLIAVYEAQVDSRGGDRPCCPLCGTYVHFEDVLLHSRKICRLRYWWWTKVLRKPIDDCRKAPTK